MLSFFALFFVPQQTYLMFKVIEKMNYDQTFRADKWYKRTVLMETRTQKDYNHTTSELKNLCLKMKQNW